LSNLTFFWMGTDEAMDAIFVQAGQEQYENGSDEALLAKYWSMWLKKLTIVWDEKKLEYWHT
jgi:Fe-S cluster biosynthesis and repair protein YggX